MKKLVSIVLALALVLLCVGAAFASTITINRDSTWDSTAENKEVTFTYYKIFDATITTAAGVNPDTGALTGNGNVVYTVDSAEKAAALPSIFTANLASDGLYYVTLTNSSTSATDIAAALKTMVETPANASLFPANTVTSDDNPVVIDNLDEAYYLILASNGKDAVVQTIGDVEIKEKNDYPTIDKKQKKAADASYSETVVPEEIGSTIYYQVTVHIPADATKAIKVIDTMTEGLTYNASSFAVSPNLTYTVLADTDPDYVSGAAWQIQFSDSVVQNNRNTDVVITYTATVNANAIVDEGKENEVTLKYDEGHYVLKDDIDYTTYFAGIYKVDPNDASANMAGVKFDLKDGSGNAVNVTYDTTNGYYVVGGSSNEVETRAETVTESGEKNILHH
jgi:fimbrial isopeptide formation D2 family protein